MAGGAEASCVEEASLCPKEISVSFLLWGGPRIRGFLSPQGGCYLHRGHSHGLMWLEALSLW